MAKIKLTKNFPNIERMNQQKKSEINWLNDFREFLLHFIQGERFENDLTNEIDKRLMELKDKKQ